MIQLQSLKDSNFLWFLLTFLLFFEKKRPKREEMRFIAECLRKILLSLPIDNKRTIKTNKIAWHYNAASWVFPM